MQREVPGVASKAAATSPPAEDSATPTVSRRSISRSATRSAMAFSSCMECDLTDPTTASQGWAGLKRSTGGDPEKDGFWGRLAALRIEVAHGAGARNVVIICWASAS